MHVFQNRLVATSVQDNCCKIMYTLCSYGDYTLAGMPGYTHWHCMSIILKCCMNLEVLHECTLGALLEINLGHCTSIHIKD